VTGGLWSVVGEIDYVACGSPSCASSRLTSSPFRKRWSGIRLRRS